MNEQLIEQLIELQTKFSFQEEMLETLDQVVTRQQLQIDTLQRDLQRYRDQLEESLLDSDQPSQAQSDDRPPHY